MTIVENIVSCPLFHGLEIHEIDVFHTALETKVYKEGEPIMSEGDPGSSIVILTKGLVSISKALTLQPASSVDDTREKALITLSAQIRPFFGEMALVRDDAKRTATVKAETDCEIIELEKGAYIKVLKANPEIGYRVMYNVARKLAGDLQRESQNVLKLTTAFSLILDE